jgi:putative flippase GtrA
MLNAMNIKEKNKPWLSVFFPAYNEEKNIETLVRDAHRVLSRLKKEYEIIIVNDGSRDQTGEIADRLALENPRVRVIHHSPNQGYGAALLSGFQAARGEYVFFTDADLQFDLKEIKKLLVYVPAYDVVLGFRAKRRDPFMRLLNAWGWNKLNRFLFGLRVKDIDGAFKLFKTHIVKQIPVVSRGAMLSAELLTRLQREGIEFKEVPVTHLPRRAGEPTGAKPAVILRAFKEMLSLYVGELGGTHFQVMSFATIGIANTLIDVVAYTALTRGNEFFAVHLITTKILTFFLGSVFSFFTNRYVTFRRRGGSFWGEAVRFYTTVGIGIVVNASSLYVFHSVLGVHDLLAVLFATAVTFIVNFLFTKFWVFKVPQSQTI